MSDTVRGGTQPVRHARTLPTGEVEPGLLARRGLLAVLAFGVLGIAQRVLPESDWGHVVDLDFEFVPPAAFSAFLLVGAALAWCQLVRRGLVPRNGVFLACLLAFMSLDEAIAIHERLEALTGVDWKILYAPLVLAAAFATVRVLLHWGPGAPAGLLLAGGGAWVVAQLCETLEWTGGGDVMVRHYVWYMIPEELLEMTGSLLFWLSAAVLLQRMTARTTT